ncbi:MAG: protein-glutamate O-methyltransferase CheR [Pyrinomonadaceae bacterium]|nr:protein-glutamate O-methyltransferase CheR [Pyrinomonadaceae bacterium]
MSMTATRVQHESAEPIELAEPEHALWRDSIRRRCGLDFSEGRRRFLSQRLRERMSLLGIESYGEYYRFVEHDFEGGREWQRLIELLLINETSFFRHPPSYEVLATYALPELMRERPGQQPGEDFIRMWSAGCSTGQEAYSMAMIFPRAAGAGQSWQTRIVGTDISERALAKARRGHYRKHELRGLPERFAGRHLAPAEGEPGVYKITDDVRAHVRFARFNLAGADDFYMPEQDVIFCQNVMIYFSLDSRREIFARLCRQLRRGGYLFLAPGESVGLQHPGATPVRVHDTMIHRRAE